MHQFHSEYKIENFGRLRAYATTAVLSPETHRGPCNARVCDKGLISINQVEYLCLISSHAVPYECKDVGRRFRG